MKKLTILMIVFFLVSCTPSIKDSLNIYEIVPPSKEDIKVTDVYKNDSMPKVRIGFVNDLRPKKIVCEMEGAGYYEAQDSTKVIQMGLERYFSQNDYAITLFNAPTLQGQLQNWIVKIDPKTFYNKVEATAEIVLSLLDKKGRVIYRSFYQGTYGASGLYFSQSDIEKTLTHAMHYAISEASKDARLRELIENNQ